MDNIYIIFLVAIPVGMILGGFLIARQIRTLQNVPAISLMFVQRKWVIVAATGLLMSGIFSLLLFFEYGFSIWSILAFVMIFLIASAAYYFGVTVGWGRSSPASENVIPSGQASINALPENLIIDETLTSVKITIHTQKRWVWFVMDILRLLGVGCCSLPIFGLMVLSAFQTNLPQVPPILSWIVVGGIVVFLIYALYGKFQEALEYVFDQEMIEIDNLSVKIEKHGSGFKSRKEYPADNIKRITTMFSFGGINTAIARSPFKNTQMPMFMIWNHRGLKRHRPFGRGVDFADAQKILEIIYRKFPQYRG